MTNLRNKKAFTAALWDYGIFAGCFGQSGAAISDIDGNIERHGFFLVFEFKGPESGVPYGQRLALQARANDGRTTVVVVWGPVNTPQRMEVIGSGRGVEPVDLAALRAYVANWWAWADRQPYPMPLPNRFLTDCAVGEVAA
jgi:hypothetical protein